MNIAMLGVRLDCGSRSERIARALRLVDAAAAADSGPDLIVVPAGCDRLGRHEAPRSRAMAESYRAGFCAKAREWGVHIALWQEWIDSDESRIAALLIDADGDVLGETRANDEGVGVVGCETVFGSVGMCLEASLSSVEQVGLDTLGPVDVLLVLGGPNAEATAARDIGAAMKARFGRLGHTVFLVRPLMESPVDDCVVCSDASVVLRREGHEAGVVAWAAIPARE